MYQFSALRVPLAASRSQGLLALSRKRHAQRAELKHYPKSSKVSVYLACCPLDPVEFVDVG